MKNGYLSKGEVQADDLTWREQEVLILLAKRRTNKEIADELHLAESTVKDYVGKILSKLYVKNRRQAVERAKALGLLETDKKSPARPLTNLPAEATPFVGRRVELAEIKQQLGETRLLTLIGPGGIGKTRLALKTAEGAVGSYKDGTFFVSLAPISLVEHVSQTIAEAVKSPIATHENPQIQLLRYLQNKQMLLVMDNFEHLLGGVGILSEILITAPGVKILATSRERLNLRPETILNVGGMSFPSEEGSKDFLNYDAINLFTQSARKVCPGFDPSAEEFGQIAYICQIVEGMPLGIELAAAWLQILTLDQITQELEKGFDILAAEVRDAPERHRSIRAVFDHSWRILHPSEQKIFKCLSVFRGGSTREAAQQVSGASLQQLIDLVNKSFLSHNANTGRLEVHELLRQYAQEKLSETPQVKTSAEEAHAAYYADFMAERWQQIKGEGEIRALAEIESDIENVRAAWRYYLHNINVPQLWKFIKCLWHIYWIRWWNHAGMELFAEAVGILQGSEDEETRALWALAMAFQGYFMAWLGLADQGYKLAEKGVENLKGQNHPEALVFAYQSLVVNAYMLNRFAEEFDAISKQIKIASEIGDKWLIAFTLFGASLASLIEENYEEAKLRAESHLALNKEIGDVIGSTVPLIVLGHIALAQGEYSEARRYYLRCLEISEDVRFHYARQTSSKYLGKVALSMGRVSEAEKYLIQGLIISKEIGFVRDIINLYCEFARLWVALDKPEKAVELLAFVLDHPASYEFRMMEGRIRDSAKDLLAEIEEELPREIYTKAVQRGQKLELDAILAELVDPESIHA